MAAYAWDIAADTATEILAADEYRDEFTVQLNAQAVPGADPVFLAFGVDAVIGEGLVLGNMGHTVRVLGAKARLAVSAISAAVSSGGIETHTSLEYRHVLNNPIWKQQQPNPYKPVVLHYWPLNGEEFVAVDWDPFVIIFDMNVQISNPTRSIYVMEFISGDILETISIADAVFLGPSVSFSLTPPLELEAETEYYITIAHNAIESTDGVACGILGGTRWRFTTA